MKIRNGWKADRDKGTQYQAEEDGFILRAGVGGRDTAVLRMEGRGQI